MVVIIADGSTLLTVVVMLQLRLTSVCLWQHSCLYAHPSLTLGLLNCVERMGSLVPSYHNG